MREHSRKHNVGWCEMPNTSAPQTDPAVSQNKPWSADFTPYYRADLVASKSVRHRGRQIDSSNNNIVLLGLRTIKLFWCIFLFEHKLDGNPHNVGKKKNLEKLQKHLKVNKSNTKRQREYVTTTTGGVCGPLRRRQRFDNYPIKPWQKNKQKTYDV